MSLNGSFSSVNSLEGLGMPIDDSLVSKRRPMKSHSFACDFEGCGCFGQGDVMCIKCDRRFHGECAVSAGCHSSTNAQDRVVCNLCLEPSTAITPPIMALLLSQSQGWPLEDHLSELPCPLPPYMLFSLIIVLRG